MYAEECLKNIFTRIVSIVICGIIMQFTVKI